jgi:hypothetical protein
MGLLENLMGTSVDDPRFAATTQLAQGLLSSPRLMQGLAQGLGGYQETIARAKQQKAAEEYRAMQIAQVRAQMEAQQRQQAQSELDARLTRQAFTGVKPIEANSASGITGPRPEALAAVGKLPAFDPAAFVASGGSPELAFSLQKSLTKTGPEYSTNVQYDQDGRAFLVAKDSSLKYLDGVAARDELITEDLGGKRVLRTKYSPEARGQYSKTYTPDALLSASTTRRGQDLTYSTNREANDIQRSLALQEKELKVGELRDKADERRRSKEGGIASIGAQIAVIDKALSHPGRTTATGLSGTIDPRNYVSGTNARDFQVVLDQLGGAAFLQAFESLKGGGQITEVEGKKATDAMARLNRAQSDGEFELALRELREIMTAGYKRLAGVDYSTPDSSPVLRWNAQTGKFE